MLYLLKDYAAAVNEYNILIAYAQGNKDLYTTELKSLYAERGWAKSVWEKNLVHKMILQIQELK